MVSPYYDSMVAKVIAHGPTRAEAVTALRTALASARLVGPATNRDQLLNVLADPEFVAGRLHTGFLDDPRATPIRGDIAVAAVGGVRSPSRPRTGPRRRCCRVSRRGGATTRRPAAR